jgi:hypothetical protein
MIIDYQNSFTVNADTQGDLAQSITATARSENVSDLGLPETGSDIASGAKMVEVWVQVTTDFDSAADDGTLVVALAADTALPMDGSSVVLQQTAAIAEAVLVAGYQFRLAQIPVGSLRYLDLNFTVAGSGDFTAGAVEAGLILDRQGNIGAY